MLIPQRLFRITTKIAEKRIETWYNKVTIKTKYLSGAKSSYDLLKHPESYRDLIQPQINFRGESRQKAK